MKIAVIGAGIIGVTTAHELTLDGHEVQVFERHGSVAAESSFANSGILGALPVAGGTPVAGLTHPLWAWKRWRSTPAASREQQQTGLCQWVQRSRERVDHWRQMLGLPLPMRGGYMLLASTPRQQRELEALAARLGQAGEPAQWLDPAQARQVDAGLDISAPMRGALLLPQFRIANARQYSHLLRGHAADMGARFAFNHVITQLVPGDKPSLGVTAVTSLGGADAAASWPRPGSSGASQQRFDAIVICTATDPDGLLRRLGLRLPLLTRQSCAVTLPLREFEAMPDLGPRAGITDLTRQVSITRLDQRLRVCSLRSFAPGRSEPPQAHLKSLFEALDVWYPGAGRVTQAQQWHGRHAHLPDGLPAIGPSHLPGIWLNMGHGLNGWALAASGARLMADWLRAGSARRPPNAELFDPARWR